MKVGFHVSIEGSLDRAVDRAVALNCDTCQIFTGNPRQWRTRPIPAEEVAAFTTKVRVNAVHPVFAHLAYLPNLASPRDEVYTHSVAALVREVDRCRRLAIPFLVLHLGSHLGAGVEIGCTRVVNGVDRALDAAERRVTLVFENAAGSPHSVGSSFEELASIRGRVSDPDQVGVCLDTCHAFAAGYDLRTQAAVDRTVTALDAVLGLETLRLVHLNDSKGDLGSHIDRHDHIGEGKIGDDGFRSVLKSRLGELPLILETPKDASRGDLDNLRKVRALASDC